MTDNADAPVADVGNQIHRVTDTARLHTGTRQPTLDRQDLRARPRHSKSCAHPPRRASTGSGSGTSTDPNGNSTSTDLFRSAHCPSSGEPNDTAAQVAWIATEDLSPFDQRPRPMPQFADVASHTGEFTGAFVDPPAPAIWLSHHWHAESHVR